MKHILSATIAAVTTFTMLAGCSFPKNSNNISVIFLDVGKADSMILSTKNHTVMIDCGLKKSGKDIVNYCEDNDISTIDYLILTHYDRDHIGGAAKVIKNLDVKNIVMPDYEEDSKEYEKLYDAIDDEDISPNILTKKLTFTLDKAKFTVYPPEKSDYGENDDNDFSLVTTVNYYDTSFLFTGDAMEQRTSEIMNIGHYDLLKVQYHGRKISNFDKFLDNVTPEYAVVSTIEDEYSSITESELQDHNVKTYTTFDDGNITFTSNGKKLSVQTQNDE